MESVRASDAEIVLQRFEIVPVTSMEEQQLAEGCAICMCSYEEEELILRMDQCMHLFHRECLKQWFIKSV